MFHYRKEETFRQPKNLNTYEMLATFQEALLQNGYVTNNTRSVYHKKTGWYWGYNSFLPMLHVAVNADGILVQYQLHKQTRVLMRIYLTICLFFGALLLIMAMEKQCSWYFSCIPFGLLCFALLLSKAGFLLSVRYVSRLLKTSMNQA